MTAPLSKRRARTTAVAGPAAHGAETGAGRGARPNATTTGYVSHGGADDGDEHAERLRHRRAAGHRVESIGARPRGFEGIELLGRGVDAERFERRLLQVAHGQTPAARGVAFARERAAGAVRQRVAPGSCAAEAA